MSSVDYRFVSTNENLFSLKALEEKNSILQILNQNPQIAFTK